MALQNKRLGAALSAVAGAALAVTPLAANADDASPRSLINTHQAAAQVTDVAYSSTAAHDAGAAAQDWSLQNRGIAVAVFLGTKSNITPAQIRNVLSQEFQGAGIRDVSFFFEQNDQPSTAVAYFYSGAVDGPFLLNQARPEAVKSAKQYLFQEGNPALAYGGYDQ